MEKIYGYREKDVIGLAEFLKNTLISVPSGVHAEKTVRDKIITSNKDINFFIIHPSFLYLNVMGIIMRKVLPTPSSLSTCMLPP